MLRSLGAAVLRARPAVAGALVQVREFSKRKRKFGRSASHRWAMLRNMVTSLIKHERITTTHPKAKSLQVVADQLIRWSKLDSIHAKQRAARVVREMVCLRKLFEVLGPRYKDRQGGYTRVVRLAKYRKGDAASMSMIEYIDREGEIRMPAAARPDTNPAPFVDRSRTAFPRSPLMAATGEETSGPAAADEAQQAAN